MLDDGTFAKCMIGASFNEQNGQATFLIADPHIKNNDPNKKL
jgi:hypothetical protein